MKDVTLRNNLRFNRIVLLSVLTFDSKESVETYDSGQLAGMCVPLLEDAVDVVVRDGLGARNEALHHFRVAHVWGEGCAQRVPHLALPTKKKKKQRFYI